MRKFRSWIVVAIVSAWVMGAGWVRADDKPDKPAEKPAAQPATTEPVAAPLPELAVRYAALAQDTLRQKVVIEPHFKEAAGLLMGAMKLDPREPRYPRMLYEAMLQMHDNDGALRALKIYRGINDQTATDQLAMVNYINLTARNMQTAEQRFEFYKQLLDSRAPDPVKSYAAFRASQVARERGQNDLEDSFMGQALRLNPLNMDALRARLAALEDDGAPVERIGVLLSMLKSNPVQPRVTYRLAREIADAGLPEESLRYYTLSVNLAGAIGVAMGREFALGYACELYMMNQPQLFTVTKAIVDQLLKQDAGDVESLLLRWLAERAGGEKDAAAKTQQQVLNASLNRLITLRQQLGAAGATTRPVDSAEALALPPDTLEDVNKLKDEKFQALRVPYTQAITDLAWYLVYVANQPAESAKLLPTLKALLSEKDPVVVRIEGWIFMAQGKDDQASIKLKAVADQDVMAQAGTLLLWAKNPAEKDPAMASARKLLMENPSGLLAVLLSDTLKPLNVKLVERADAPAIKQQVEAFPKNWLRIIDAPQNFYQLRAEMIGSKIIFRFGEPMLARVFIKNISEFDITIGPEGVIRNDLWFDAQLRGLVQQMVAGAAYERLSQVLVLKPGQIVTQTVRLDQGQLADVLTGNPNPALTFYGQVRTNPLGNGGSGPGGYGVAFSSITERAGFGLNENAIRGLTATVASGKSDEKVRSLELIVAEIEQLRRMQEPTDQSKMLVSAFIEALQKSAGDVLAPGVSTWGSFLAAMYDPARRPAMMQRLLDDPEPTRRLLGLFIANGLPMEQQKQLVAKVLQSDKEEMIQLYVSGMMDLIQIRASLPTTAPASTQPAAPAAPNLIPSLPSVPALGPGGGSPK